MQDPLFDVIEEKARTDGRFAIAYALLELTDAVKDLGFGRRADGLYPGTTEKIAMEVADIGKALDDIASALSSKE